MSYIYTYNIYSLRFRRKCRKCTLTLWIRSGLCLRTVSSKLLPQWFHFHWWMEEVYLRLALCRNQYLVVFWMGHEWRCYFIKKIRNKFWFAPFSNPQYMTKSLIWSIICMFFPHEDKILPSLNNCIFNRNNT